MTVELRSIFTRRSERFLPGLKQVPGIGSLSVSEGDLMGPAGAQIPYAKVINASFGSLGEAMAARQSQAGQSDNEELRRFGVQVLMYQTKEI
ncbi:MAG: hypothetical protein M3O99_04885 [Chloroflexota bacterium]|nr:hypothetical protein [Chloroflexota bacterium]